MDFNNLKEFNENIINTEFMQELRSSHTYLYLSFAPYPKEIIHLGFLSSALLARHSQVRTLAKFNKNNDNVLIDST